MGCSGSKTATAGTVEHVKTLATEEVTAGAKSKTLLSPETEVKSVKAVVATPAAQASVDVTKLLNEKFDQLDTNGDGFVSKEELAVALDHLLECSHIESRKSMRTLLAESRLNPYISTFEQMDTNHDGKISREEFQASMHPSQASKTIEHQLKDVFDRIDVNKDGNLSQEEFSRAFNNLLTKSCVKSQRNFKELMMDAGLNPDVFVSGDKCDAATTSFRALDANNDGVITWEEFRAKLRPAFDSMQFLRSVFNKMDADGDGSVSKDELTTSFERILDCSEIKSKKSFRTLVQEAGLNTEFYVFEQLDTNADGRITWDEFEACLKPAAAQQDTNESVTREAVAADLLSDSVMQAGAVVEEEEASVKCLCGGW